MTHGKHPPHHSVRHSSHTHTQKVHALSDGHASFIKECSEPAQISEQETGVPASITIAQAILESGWGQRHIGEANNYFGVKAQTARGKVVYGDIASGYVDRSTKEHLRNKDVTVTAHFRSYSSMTDSFRDHGMFLRNNPRYHAALDAYAKTGDADEFARGLQKAGYATDPDYAQSLIAIMKKHNLYQYNRARQDP
jgi:flagellum-specific peptidoglycan hydrolase FlgJ